MRLVVKRREVTDPAQLQALVIDHVDGIEPGLAVLDSRLLLGQATIDVVGLDAHGVLVLMVVAFTADEEMLLKAVEAYSWCLEYPEAIRRLYPSAQVSSAQPPRLMFVVERMPDSFHRKIKQLGFPQVDCVAFRHLDVDGTPAVYFETLARLRRGPVAAAAPAPEPVVTAPAPGPAGRPTSLKLQKLLGADRPGAVREPAQVVSMVHRTAPRAETSKPVVNVLKMESAVAPRIADAPAIVRPVAAVEAPAAAVTETVESAFVPAAILVPEPEPVVAEPVARVEPVVSIAVAPEPIAAPIATLETVTEPVATAEPIVEEPIVKETVLNAAVAPNATPAPEVVTPIALEPVVDTLDAPEPRADVAATDIVAVATPETSSGTPELELTLETIAPGEPQVTAAELDVVAPNTPDVEPILTVVTTPDPEPMLAGGSESFGFGSAPAQLEVAPVAAAPIEKVEPAAMPAPAPSAFARRPAEIVAAPAEPKVSFADAAKDLLAVTNPTPRSESPVTIQRPSVEEMTRAALNDLVGATPKPAAEERATAFAKPSGAFSKPAAPKAPRTIAAPPPDPQPIASSKLGAAPKRMAQPRRGAQPQAAPAPAAEPEAAQPVPPQGFEGLKFPNDGVLTRQWMEFLNQMAAGK